MKPIICTVGHSGPPPKPGPQKARLFGVPRVANPESIAPGRIPGSRAKPHAPE